MLGGCFPQPTWRGPEARAKEASNVADENGIEVHAPRGGERPHWAILEELGLKIGLTREEMRQAMDALTALKTRVSPLKLAEPGPTAEALEAMFAAAVAAPDHGRLRPWRFLIFDGAARERFGTLLEQSLLRREPEAPAAKRDAERKKAERAPLIIVAAATVKDDAKIPAVEQIVAVGAAAQNLLVAAHALGYGGFWRTGAAAYDAVFKRELGLAESDAIVGFLYVGSVATPGQPRRSETADAIRRLPS